MGIFDRWFGRGEAPRAAGTPNPGFTSASAADEAAIERYRYLMRTAPPDALEQAHAEAFARLTPEQRRIVLEQLSAEMPEAERAAATGAGESPGALARVATRAELRQPGALERAYGRIGNSPARGMSFGGLMAGSFLSSMAGAVLGTAIAQNFFDGRDLGGSAIDSGADAGSYADDAGGGFDGGGDFGGGGFDV